MIKQEYDFERDGFIVLRKVFDEAAMAPVRKLLLDTVSYAERELEDPFGRYYLKHRADQGVLFDLYQRHPEFDALARSPVVLDALVPVLGDDIFMYENTVVYKPKGKKNGIPFHQDFLSRPNEPRKYISWIALQPVTRTGGAMKLVPGSHKLGFQKWHRVKGDAFHDRINPETLDTSGMIYGELDPGDVLIFNQLVVHGSDEAHTDSLRLVYRVSYQGFEEVVVPRGSPIVMRGGTPASLAQRFPQPYQPPARKNILRRAVNKVGRKLAQV